eukprot:scaffold53_cov193-Pinguiococcus_pyrenoidosus.AAC.2
MDATWVGVVGPFAGRIDSHEERILEPKAVHLLPMRKKKLFVRKEVTVSSILFSLWIGQEVYRIKGFDVHWRIKIHPPRKSETFALLFDQAWSHYSRPRGCHGAPSCHGSKGIKHGVYSPGFRA